MAAPGDHSGAMQLDEVRYVFCYDRPALARCERQQGSIGQAMEVSPMLAAGPALVARGQRA